MSRFVLARASVEQDLCSKADVEEISCTKVIRKAGVEQVSYSKSR